VLDQVLDSVAMARARRFIPGSMAVSEIAPYPRRIAGEPEPSMKR
jgi:hypothetical protein